MNYNFIIKGNAIVITIVIAIILAIVWIIIAPIMFVGDIISLFIELVTDNKYYHNNIAVSFINYITNIKEIYKKMTDKNMINDYLKDCGIK